MYIVEPVGFHFGRQPTRVVVYLIRFLKKSVAGLNRKKMLTFMSHVEITDFLVYFIRRRHEDAGLSHMRIEYIFFKPEKRKKERNGGI